MTQSGRQCCGPCQPSPQTGNICSRQKSNEQSCDETKGNATRKHRRTLFRRSRKVENNNPQHKRNQRVTSHQRDSCSIRLVSTGPSSPRHFAARVWSAPVLSWASSNQLVPTSNQTPSWCASAHLGTSPHKHRRWATYTLRAPFVSRVGIHPHTWQVFVCVRASGREHIWIIHTYREPSGQVKTPGPCLRPLTYSPSCLQPANKPTVHV